METIWKEVKTAQNKIVPKAYSYCSALPYQRGRSKEYSYTLWNDPVGKVGLLVRYARW